MHTSLENAFYPPRILFPDIDHMGNLQRPTQPEMDDLLLMNHSIRRSPPQLMAVAAIFNLPPGSVPFIISGAPGTGKTITIIEAIRQLLYKDRSIRVLVCAPSNAESDVICELLSPLGPLHLFRLNSPARAVSSVSSNLKQFCREEGGVFAMPHEMQLMKYRVVVSTCIVASTLGQTGITRTHFTHIFVDNAGLPLEPEVLIPMRTIGGLQTNLILSGDPLQLTPEVNSPVVEALGAQISYLDRLMGMPIYDDPLHNGITIVKLSHNFRNHSSILKFSIDAFYAKWQEQSLISVIDSSSALGGGLSQEFPIIFHATKGEDHQPPSGPSYFNPVEASMAKIYVLDSLTSPSFRLNC
ncbi:hypothetical protein FRC02_000698 [Tulasnella sp. 418]|nr:hypothetical protein FRC02_000698 [Tulasnella sp. 418]